MTFLGLMVAPAGATGVWTPAPDSRQANRPKTCLGSGCTDSGATFAMGGGPSIAASNNGTTHYLYANWVSDQPPGQRSQALVSRGAGCSAIEDPLTGADSFCMGTYFARSTDGGATWSEPLRISPEEVHSERVAIAASGPNVYSLYVTQVGYERSMCASSPRALYVRVSNDYGANFGIPIRLTDIANEGNRIDDPSIAAWGNNAYVIYTSTPPGSPIGATSGVTTSISTDSGATFVQRRVGYTSATYDNTLSPGGAACPDVGWSPPSVEGNDGAPVIAGNGTQVGAAWFSNDEGKLVAKISEDNGASWPGGDEGMPCDPGLVFDEAGCTIHLSGAAGKGPIGQPDLCPSFSTNPGACGLGRPAVAAGFGGGSGGRIAFGWIEGGAFRTKALYVRQWKSVGGWSGTNNISCLTDVAPCQAAPAGQLYDNGFAPTVAIWGETGIAAAWSVCPKAAEHACSAVASDNNTINDAGAEILYKETGDGQNWTADLIAQGSFKEIVGNGPGARECTQDSDPCSAINEWPTIIFDTPGSAGFGCGQQPANLAPNVGCVRYVGYTGRNHQYTSYQRYLQKGTQT